MSPFARIHSTGSPLRVVQVGAGGMGRKWIEAIKANADVELVGLVDLNPDTAHAAAREFHLGAISIGTGLTEVARESSADAVINVTVPVAHHPVSMEALSAGLPVLSEKPVAPTVAEGLSLAAAAEVTGQLLMISQSRRYYRALTQLKAQVEGLGDLGVVTSEFFKAPHFGGFREEMEHVLLVDMAIHPFDLVRYLLDQDPVSVYCEEFNPSWSWYAGDAAATAIFEMSGGTRFIYTGSWCSDGLETSWNGSWRINGEHGTARWDGDSSPMVEHAPSTGNATSAGPVGDQSDHAEEIAGALEEFISALRTGVVPSGEVHSNVLSLVMVEAAVMSAESRQRILIADVVEEAYQRAIAVERRPDVKAALMSWGAPQRVLAKGVSSSPGAPTRGS